MSKLTIMTELKHQNNIQNWMETNLTKADYDKLIVEIPGMLGITKMTWFNYRTGRTEIGITTLQKLYDILAPYGCEHEGILIKQL